MTNELAFDIRGIAKTWPYFSLRNVSMQLEYGQILGFIGPNGAGKSTTIRMLMGLLAPESGSIEVFGLPMPREQVAIKYNVGFVSADMQLYPLATAAWHIDWMARIYPSWDHAYATLLIERFNLHPQQKVKELSLGERMKLLHLLALARRPRLLVLDEPTTGLDPVARHEVLAEITGIMQDERRAVLFSSHHTQDVEQISDRIVFIDRGEIVADQDRETYLESWRRLVLDTAPGFVAPEFPGFVACKQTPHSAVITVNRFDDALLPLVTQAGAAVRAVETMTLEEIFVASVVNKRQSNKQGEAA